MIDHREVADALCLGSEDCDYPDCSCPRVADTIVHPLAPGSSIWRPRLGPPPPGDGPWSDAPMDADEDW